MTVKQQVLSILEAHRGEAISGELLAKTIQCSRNAVWKAINSLKEEGYAITGVNNKGYCLSKQTDILSEEGIRTYLAEEYQDQPIAVFDLIDSTNRYAKEQAAMMCENGLLVVANRQSAGRGRRGRSFFSPADTGLYMTIVLKTDTHFSNGIFYTTQAAVAVCHAIEACAPELNPRIKWVNDVYINGKKVCGILTEAVTDIETGMIGYVVIGIGVNVSTTDFPNEVAPIAGAMFAGESTGIRNHLAALIYNEIMNWAKNPEDNRYMEEYRERSILLGENVVYTFGNESAEGKALRITDVGEMVLLTESGEELVVSSGECSVKPLNYN